MRMHARNIIAVLVLIGILYAVTNYSGQIQKQIGVKGASTNRAQEIAGRIGSDVSSQAATAKNQAMHVSLSDILNYFARFQRIPQDITNIKNFSQDELNNMLQSKNTKK